jgi:Mg-chelatase subunit ChlD
MNSPHPHTNTGSNSTSDGADIWFLIDRSGSMTSIADDVVTGFDRFFTEQREIAGDATVTIIQFDDETPHDVIVDAQPVAKVPSIRDLFQPRGMTPLYDAAALLLDRAEAHRGDPDDQLVVIFTDGHENASHEWTHKQLFARINGLRSKGWTFVFLGANQDSYATGAQLAMPAGNVSNFRADAVGVAAMTDGLSRSVTEWRRKPRDQRRRDGEQFWGGKKEAETIVGSSDR